MSRNSGEAAWFSLAKAKPIANCHFNGRRYRYSAPDSIKFLPIFTCDWNASWCQKREMSRVSGEIFFFTEFDPWKNLPQRMLLSGCFPLWRNCRNFILEHVPHPASPILFKFRLSFSHSFLLFTCQATEQLQLTLQCYNFPHSKFKQKFNRSNIQILKLSNWLTTNSRTSTNHWLRMHRSNGQHAREESPL